MGCLPGPGQSLRRHIHAGTQPGYRDEVQRGWDLYSLAHTYGAYGSNKARLKSMPAGGWEKRGSQPRGPGPFPPEEAGWEGAGTRAWALGIGQALADFCPGHFLASRASVTLSLSRGGWGSHEMMPVNGSVAWRGHYRLYPCLIVTVKSLSSWPRQSGGPGRKSGRQTHMGWGMKGGAGHLVPSSGDPKEVCG